MKKKYNKGEKKCKKYTGIHSDTRANIFHIQNLKKYVRNRPNPDCSICLDSIYNDKTIIKPITLFCGHTFHCECIKKWFIYNNRCPMCRANISQYQYQVMIFLILINFRYI